MITAIAAVTITNRVIGKDNKIPWNLPGDMKHFREVTTGGVVVMGRKTFESIGRPLPRRENWILTANPDYITPTSPHATIKVFGDFPTLLNWCRGASDLGEKEVFVIGGEEIYKLFMPHIDQQIITWIDDRFELIQGDAHYPYFDNICGGSSSEWTATSQSVKDTTEQYPYWFTTYKKSR